MLFFHCADALRLHFFQCINSICMFVLKTLNSSAVVFLQLSDQCLTVALQPGYSSFAVCYGLQSRLLFFFQLRL
jgi:hypothetical protein